MNQMIKNSNKNPIVKPEDKIKIPDQLKGIIKPKVDYDDFALPAFGLK